MNTDLWLMLVQGLLVLGFISLGVRTGGISIGLWGGVGVLVLVAVFGLEPGAVPISAMLIILAVVAAAGAMQVAGGVQYLVSIAQRIIRADPKRVTFLRDLPLDSIDHAAFHSATNLQVQCVHDTSTRCRLTHVNGLTASASYQVASGFALHPVPKSCP